jgi:hypothetical protein
VSAQRVGGGRHEQACDVTLATLAAALAATQVLAHLDGHPPASAVGGVVEFDLLDGRLRRKSLTAHAACGCGAASAEATMEA